jgi:Rv2258c-like winged HTH domain
MATQQLDEATKDAFAEQMLDALNSASLTHMTSVGYRTGLFDATDGLAPSTSQQIADATKLNERYVREWLGAMVTGRVVHYEPRDRTYSLPAEHAASLTRAAGPDNIAAMRRTSRSSGASRAMSLSAFGRVAASRTRHIRACRNSWTTSPARSTTPRSLTGPCPLYRDSSSASRRASTSPTSAAAPATPST